MTPIHLKLEKFEGPFDLLYHLIEKSEIDIYDIPIAEITEQYLEYLRLMEQLDLEIASEFLVMATTLLEIKSRMLLPKIIIEDDDKETEDPRQELVQKLVEYKKYKEASILLKDRMLFYERQFFKEPEMIGEFSEGIGEYHMDISILYESFRAILNRREERERQPQEQHIFRDEITVEVKMQDIRRFLRYHTKFDWRMILERCETKLEAIISFIAILELIKLCCVKAEQMDGFGNIYIERVD